MGALGWLDSQANEGGTGGLQVADRCRRVGVLEVHGGCAHKGCADLLARELCRLVAPGGVACVIYTKIEKLRFKVNPNLRDVAKNQNQF